MSELDIQDRGSGFVKDEISMRDKCNWFSKWLNFKLEGVQKRFRLGICEGQIKSGLCLEKCSCCLEGSVTVGIFGRVCVPATCGVQ